MYRNVYISPGINRDGATGVLKVSYKKKVVKVCRYTLHHICLLRVALLQKLLSRKTVKICPCDHHASIKVLIVCISPCSFCLVQGNGMDVEVPQFHAFITEHTVLIPLHGYTVVMAISLLFWLCAIPGTAYASSVSTPPPPPPPHAIILLIRLHFLLCVTENWTEMDSLGPIQGNDIDVN